MATSDVRVMLLAFIAVCVSVAGCSSLKWPVMTPVEDIVASRHQRKREALTAFAQRRDWAEFQAADNARRQGDVERCRESLERILARNPRHLEARQLLTKLNENKEDDLTAIDSHDARAGDLVAKGTVALADGNADAAIDLFNRALAAAPDDPRVPINAATAALRFDHPDIAVNVGTRAIDHFGDSAALLRVLGVAYYRSGDYESAQVVFQQTLSLDNTSALTYFLQGCTLMKLGQLDAAERHLCRAAEIDPRYASVCRRSKTN